MKFRTYIKWKKWARVQNHVFFPLKLARIAPVLKDQSSILSYVHLMADWAAFLPRRRQRNRLKRSRDVKVLWQKHKNRWNYLSPAFSGQFFRICSPKEKYVCSTNETLRRTMRQRKFLCWQDCKLACEVVNLSSQISSATVTREAYKNLDRKESTIPREGASPVFLHIFLNQFVVTVVEEISTVTFVSVVANIGGAMGAFLGASLITVAEFIVFALCYIQKQSTVFRESWKI